MLKTLDQLIVSAGALAVAVIAFLISDPIKVQSLTALITGAAVPFLSLLIGIIYVSIKGSTVNIEAKAELARAEASKAQAQLQLSKQQSRGVASSSGGYTYTVKDVEIVLNEAIADIKSGNVAVDPVNTATYDYTHMANYDLRPVQKEKRVGISKAFLEKNLSLLNEAWKYATNIPVPPTPEQAANKTTNMYYFKKEYNKYNPDNPCGQNTYALMSSLLGYFNNVYSALSGVNSLVGVTVDYSTFGDSMYSPTLLGWEAANLVV